MDFTDCNVQMAEPEYESTKIKVNPGNSFNVKISKLNATILCGLSAEG